MQKIKIGIIGFGLSGSVFHAPIINAVAGFELTAITSSRPEAVLSHYPNLKIYPDADSLLADPEIDLVIVTAPNQLHFSLAKQALAHHKHVVVEKPFVLNTTEGEALIRLAEENNLVLSVYHNRRWDNDFMALQSCIREGLLGDIYQCEIRFERFRPQISTEKWREKKLPGSGLLYDLGSHLIDQALCLFGWPNSIYADIASQRDEALVDDYVHLLLGYEKTKVILHVSSVAKNPGPRFLVHGSKGTFTKYGFDPQERLLGQRVKEKAAGSIYKHTREHAYFDNDIEILYEENGVDMRRKIQEPMGDYRQYYQLLYQAIVAKGPVPVTAEAGLDCVRVIECAMRSYLHNETVFVSGSLAARPLF